MSTLRTGPVVITGSTGQIGRALQKRLSDLPNEVRALDRTSSLSDAMRGAAAVVHLAGTLRPRRSDTYRAANLATAEATAAAVAGSSVERLVFLSFVTARPESANPYLRYKACAEQVLRATGVPTVVFRTGHVLGTPDAPGPTASALLARDGGVTVLGPGSQRVAPIQLADVVEAVVNATLDPGTPTGTFELAGPQVLAVDDLVRALNRDPVSLRHLPAWLARRLAGLVPSLPRPLVEVMSADAVPDGDPVATADAFGITLHGLADVWP